MLLTPALSSFGEERENYFVGRSPRAGSLPSSFLFDATSQPWANFRSAFSAAKARPAYSIRPNSWNPCREFGLRGRSPHQLSCHSCVSWLKLGTRLTRPSESVFHPCESVARNNSPSPRIRLRLQLRRDRRCLSVVFHSNTGTNRIAVAEDVVHAGDGGTEFVVVQALGRERGGFASVGRYFGAHAASTRAQRISSSRSSSILDSPSAITATVSPTALNTSRL